ncbi:MAG: UreD urease accessory protein-domain-containing protein [Olpidium bornovanus]|uniref:UreD urease accessory protein-domain-containing protein n=1 Tax=Olpidium bornovanus TaxID=278681 RepID=A0A8H7ZRN9_9FUNG|nr:MAG: UreD urease accessory protein-domain-containing protein [Olpidium bornovanus]
MAALAPVASGAGTKSAEEGKCHLLPGHGRICVVLLGGKARLASLQARYPLKLISPRNALPRSPGAACVYVLAYGGGLVGGDATTLDVEVGAGATLGLLSQGSTKVFKARSPGDWQTSSQTLTCRVHAGATLAVLPGPVTPFRNARYSQRTSIDVGPGGSLLWLDWVTSGRREMTPPAKRRAADRGGDPAGPAGGGGPQGLPDEAEEDDRENWSFALYESSTSVRRCGRVVVRDSTRLDNDGGGGGDAFSRQACAASPDLPSPPPGPPSARSTLVSHLMRPYSAIATLILQGPACAELVAYALRDFEELSYSARPSAPPAVVWSASPVREGTKEGDDVHGVVIRAAASDTETLHQLLKQRLRGVERIIGGDLWDRCL